RHNSTYLGRFMSVDPVGGNPTDPQSWNGYAYVRNNPINLIDPTGMDGTVCLQGPGGSSCGTISSGGGSGGFVYGGPVVQTGSGIGPGYGSFDSNFMYTVNISSTWDPHWFVSNLSRPAFNAPSYPQDGSILSQIVNDPSLRNNWYHTFNGATNWVNVGAAWTG